MTGSASPSRAIRRQRRKGEPPLSRSPPLRHGDEADKRAGILVLRLPGDRAAVVDVLRRQQDKIRFWRNARLRPMPGSPFAEVAAAGQGRKAGAQYIPG